MVVVGVNKKKKPKASRSALSFFLFLKKTLEKNAALCASSAAVAYLKGPAPARLCVTGIKEEKKHTHTN